MTSPSPLNSVIKDNDEQESVTSPAPHNLVIDDDDDDDPEPIFVSSTLAPPPPSPSSLPSPSIENLVVGDETTSMTPHPHSVINDNDQSEPASVPPALLPKIDVKNEEETPTPTTTIQTPLLSEFYDDKESGDTGKKRTYAEFQNDDRGFEE